MITLGKGIIVNTLALLALSGCSASWDMQGYDPVNYYEQHPIRNTIETRTKTTVVYVNSMKAKVTGSDEDKLRSQLHGISMAAVESVKVGLSKHDSHNEERKTYIAKLMRHIGYTRDAFTYETDTDILDNHASLSITYAVAVAPDCPDWRASPVTSYSNTTQGNFRCSQEVNTGLMVADPHDLAGGNGEVLPDSERSTKAVQNYHSGSAAQASPSAASAAASASGSAASAAAPAAQ